MILSVYYLLVYKAPPWLSFYLIFKYCEIARADIIIIISSLIRTLKFPSIVDGLSYESQSLGQVSLVVLNLKASNR